MKKLKINIFQRQNKYGIVMHYLNTLQETLIYGPEPTISIRRLLIGMQPGEKKFVNKLVRMFGILIDMVIQRELKGSERI